jgi:hypothetical protein
MFYFLEASDSSWLSITVAPFTKVGIQCRGQTAFRAPLSLSPHLLFVPAYHRTKVFAMSKVNAMSFRPLR